MELHIIYTVQWVPFPVGDGYLLIPIITIINQ